MNAALTPKRLFSASEAAFFLGMGKTKFRQLVDDGRISAPVVIDGLVRWEIDDLNEFADGLTGRRSVAAKAPVRAV